MLSFFSVCMQYEDTGPVVSALLFCSHHLPPLPCSAIVLGGSGSLFDDFRRTSAELSVACSHPTLHCLDCPLHTWDCLYIPSSWSVFKISIEICIRLVRVPPPWHPQGIYCSLSPSLLQGPLRATTVQNWMVCLEWPPTRGVFYFLV